MFCPYCGKEISEESQFCPYCGSSLALPEEPHGEHPEQNAWREYDERAEWSESDARGTWDDRTGYNGEIPHAAVSRSRRLPLILGIAAGAAALVLILILVVLPNRGGSDSSTASRAESEAASDTSEAANAAPDPMDSSDSTSAAETAPDPVEAEPLTGFEAIAAAVRERTAGQLGFVSSDVSEYPLVKLYFSYDDANGTPITLTTPDCAIRERLEGGQEIERTIRSIQQLKGNQGLSVDIVADKSGSMEGEPLWEMQEVMTDFVQTMDFANGDRAEFLSFDHNIMYMCTYTDNPELLKNGISNMTAYGGTALYDALIAGIRNAAVRTGARCVIGFTDGLDESSTSTMEEVIQCALQNEVPVYLIGTSDADAGTLENIAVQTGGRFWSVSNISGMQEIMDEIYSRQKDMYCITYESEASADPYSTRSVSCVLADDTYGGEVSQVEFTPIKAIEQTTHEKRYELIKGDVSWNEANQACLARGGHLATITSQAEMDELSKLAQDNGVRFVWLGGYTSKRDGSIFGHWITGEPFDYTAWYPGEPSWYDPNDQVEEFYLMLWEVDGKWSWNDQRDDVLSTGLKYFPGKIAYICEYEQ